MVREWSEKRSTKMLKYIGDYRYYKGERSSYHRVDKSPFVIGRGTTADFRVDGLEVARAHCQLSKLCDQEVGLLLECTSRSGLSFAVVAGPSVHGPERRLLLGEKKVLTEDTVITLAGALHLLFVPRCDDSIDLSQDIEIETVGATMAAEKELPIVEERLAEATVPIHELMGEQVLKLDQEMNVDKMQQENDKLFDDNEKLVETVRQELSAALESHEQELANARASTLREQANAAEERKDLLQQLQTNKIKLHDSEKLVETVRQELSAALESHEQELANARAATLREQANAAEERNDLLQQLREKEMTGLQAKRRIEDLQVELESQRAATEEARAEQITKFEELVETDLECAICVDMVIAATVLNCGHTFCNECICEWYIRSLACPTCRIPIRAMQKCKMLDSFIPRAARMLGEGFQTRRREATNGRHRDSQGQLLRN